MICRADVTRFWSHVDTTAGPHACWQWLLSVDIGGYGKFSAVIGGVRKHLKAHRFAFFLQHGHWPVHLATHECDNARCCNPSHLKDATQKVNRADCAARGRTARSLNHGLAKLSDDNVRAIRASCDSNAKLARRFGVHRTTIWSIRSGRARQGVA